MPSCYLVGTLGLQEGVCTTACAEAGFISATDRWSTDIVSSWRLSEGPREKRVKKQLIWPVSKEQMKKWPQSRLQHGALITPRHTLLQCHKHAE